MIDCRLKLPNCVQVFRVSNVHCLLTMGRTPTHQTNISRLRRSSTCSDLKIRAHNFGVLHMLLYVNWKANPESRRSIQTDRKVCKTGTVTHLTVLARITTTATQSMRDYSLTDEGATKIQPG